MARSKTKWKYILLIYVILLSVFTKSLPLERTQSLKIVHSSFVNVELTESEVPTERYPFEYFKREPITEIPVPLNSSEGEGNKSNVTALSDIAKSVFRNVRPGQIVRNYNIEITLNEQTFEGRVVMEVQLTQSTSDPLEFHAVDLDIQAVRTGIFTSINAIDANFKHNGEILEITPPQNAANYFVVIEYTGNVDVTSPLYEGEFDGLNYLAMNLHATNARRVFPCMDELTAASTISFTFNDIPYENIIMNSQREDVTLNQFRPLLGPASLWGMVAHNFTNINSPTANVQLYARPGLSNQENQASVAINFYFNNMEEWTLKPYTDIVLDQDGGMQIFVLPDIHKDWYALSTVCIWEPYVLMESIHSIKQRKEALIEIAEAISRQWFGYVIFPENWRYQWVVTGLASYAAYDMNREFQSTPEDDDVTLIDFNTIFVIEVIQESLYRDAYAIAQPLEPGDDLCEEDEIRAHIYGNKLLKYKAPAIMWMMNLILGDEDTDFIKSAGQLLINSRSLETVNTRFFIDGILNDWFSEGNGRVDNLEDFLQPWIQTNGYPVVHVGLRQGGVLITQEKFGFSAAEQVNYEIPITWTSSVEPNFDLSNARNIEMTDGTMTINVELNDEDFMLFNIQGQGYYRVYYDATLWKRIIDALEDPEKREMIHPLNRATLVDDALNLARAGILDYEIAFMVVLTMEHETEYPVWKAFVRNMNFLRKRLEAYIDGGDDLDPDIYLRMVRRTIGKVEDELGFYPDILVTEPSMKALTRGLVMDHACRANYPPCIAAAVDWFYDSNIRDARVVNPNIPHEIRPAVYCTMVRKGDDEALDALYDRLEIETVMYERIVIIESLACSEDNNFIRSLLEETVTNNSPWSVEERNRIFAAVVEGSYANTGIAMNFISSRTDDVRRMYGGHEKLEELIWMLAENMADGSLSEDFNVWVTSSSSELADSELVAIRANSIVQENMNWQNAYLEYVYEWIDRNDAPTLATSLLLILGSSLVAMFYC